MSTLLSYKTAEDALGVLFPMVQESLGRVEEARLGRRPSLWHPTVS